MRRYHEGRGADVLCGWKIEKEGRRLGVVGGKGGAGLGNRGERIVPRQPAGFMDTWVHSAYTLWAIVGERFTGRTPAVRR